MKVKNVLYKGQGIHVITSIFTVDDGITKVLLIKRKNVPFKGDWVLTGGALYFL
jgi:ADP-ribose pyrophosphatase YjhB (NUDIX family)